MSKVFNPNNEPITLGQLTERLKVLSQDGKNDWMYVSFKHDDVEFPIANVFICQDPDYNFDEANCGPDEWVELTDC